MNNQYQFLVQNEPPDGEKGYHYRFQIIEVANTLGYLADLRTHRAWVSLVLQTDSRAEILVSFHGIGPQFRGVIAVSAVYFRKDQTDAAGQEITDLTPLSEEIFQLNYKDDANALTDRFESWLDAALARGLEAWRRGL